MKAAALLLAALVLASSPAHARKPGHVIDLPGLHAAVRVDRDTDGIPHIRAHDLHDLAMVQGYVMASDRLFQMDLARRQASGTLAELVGPSALGDDVEIRIIGLRRAAGRSLSVLSAQTCEALDAFAAGVNAWAATHPLPPEYALLEIGSFEPWSAVDSVVIGKGLAFQLSFDLDIENTLIFQSYLQTGAAAGFDGQALFFEDLFRAAPFHPAATVPDAQAAGPHPRRGPRHHGHDGAIRT